MIANMTDSVTSKQLIELEYSLAEIVEQIQDLKEHLTDENSSSPEANESPGNDFKGRASDRLVVDANFLQMVRPELLTGLFKPFTFGEQSGKEWLETVNDMEIIHEAAVRSTTNEQIKAFIDYYRKRRAEGLDPLVGNCRIIYPTHEKFDDHKAISDYFKEMQRYHFYYKGFSDGDDDLLYSGDGYCISEVPNFLFREFEQGWTSAVRDFYKSALLDYEISCEEE